MKFKVMKTLDSDSVCKNAKYNFKIFKLQHIFQNGSWRPSEIWKPDTATLSGKNNKLTVA